MPVVTEDLSANHNNGGTALAKTAVQQTLTDNSVAEKIQPKSKPVYRFFKRCGDIAVSVLALTVGLPIYLVIALIIMIDDFGTPFFVQERIGKGGKPFKMIKFRTMYKDAEARKAELETENEYDDVHFKIKDDPRITKVGRVLRKTSLDEIPQAINLLNGTMTIIGPRPFIRSEQEQLPVDRLAVKPGISCYWQITDTTKMSSEEQLELDYKYIRERSLLTDIKIIFLTIRVVFKGYNC